MSDPTPLYEQDQAPVTCDTDLIILLTDQDGTTYRRIREQLEALDFEPFPFALRAEIGNPLPADLGPDAEPSIREPFATLSFLDTLAYVPEFSVPVEVHEPIELTDEGQSAADALRSGLEEDQAAAIKEESRLE